MMSSTRDDQVPTAVMWDEVLLSYKFSEAHPMAPARLELTHALAEQLDVFAAENIQQVTPPEATDEQLALVHSSEFIDAVRSCSAGDGTGRQDVGLGTEDNPVFEGLHAAAARIAGGSMKAAEMIWSGEVQHAVNFAGGLHHAHRTRPAGSASTTTAPWPSSACWNWVPNAWPTWTWTPITGTAWSRSSGTTPAC